ncbi:MAG: CRTAC1 family protein [Pirellulaceae bacterium]
MRSRFTLSLVPVGRTLAWATLLCLPGCQQSVPVQNEGEPSARQQTTSTNHALFVDITKSSQVNVNYKSGHSDNNYALLETVGGGVALVDFDHDGLLDLFFAGGGRLAREMSAIRGERCKLFRNVADLKFHDVSSTGFVPETAFYSHGVTGMDYNADGWTDLLVTGYGGVQLLQNQGDGSFLDVTRDAGLEVFGWFTAAAAADLDRDGNADLFLSQYCDWKPEFESGRFCGDAKQGIRDSCPPQDFDPAPDLLFRNSANGQFESVTEAANVRADGRGLGVVAGDFNGDDWIDVFVANDAGNNHLYWGGDSWPLREAGLAGGVATNEYGLPEGSMGIAVADYDGDLDPDLFVTNFELENNSLYRNDGNDFFQHMTAVAGLSGDCFSFTGFGAGFGDMDGDGWEDLFVVNGSVYHHTGQSPYRQPAYLFKNNQGRFQDVSASGGSFFEMRHPARGAALGDLNNDGALDLVIVRQNEPAVVLRGTQAPKRWLSIELRGVGGDPRAVGAVVSTVYQGRQLARWVVSGQGYLSQFDTRFVFPRDADVDEPVFVRWPSGTMERFNRLRDGRTNLLVEGEGVETGPAS